MKKGEVNMKTAELWKCRECKGVNNFVRSIGGLKGKPDQKLTMAYLKSIVAGDSFVVECSHCESSQIACFKGRIVTKR